VRNFVRSFCSSLKSGSIALNVGEPLATSDCVCRLDDGLDPGARVRCLAVSRDSSLLFSAQGDFHVCKATADFSVEPYDFLMITLAHLWNYGELLGSLMAYREMSKKQLLSKDKNLFLCLP